MDISIRHLRFLLYISYKTTFFQKNIFVYMFLFSGDLKTNVDFSDFIFVKIYSKFDVRKQKLFLSVCLTENHANS